MDARMHAWRNPIDSRIDSSTVVNARGRRGGDATTNGRRKIIYIYICAFSSRAREGETRRGIEETRD